MFGICISGCAYGPEDPLGSVERTYHVSQDFTPEERTYLIHAASNVREHSGGNVRVLLLFDNGHDVQLFDDPQLLGRSNGRQLWLNRAKLGEDGKAWEVTAEHEIWHTLGLKHVHNASAIMCGEDADSCIYVGDSVWNSADQEACEGMKLCVKQ